MSDITPERIAELRALIEKATPGPWSYDDGITDDKVEPPERGKPAGLYGVGMIGGLPMLCGVPPDDRDDQDGRLIAAMRNAFPALLDAAEERDRLRAEVEKQQDQLNSFLRKKEECVLLLREARAMTGKDYYVADGIRNLRAQRDALLAAAKARLAAGNGSAEDAADEQLQEAIRRAEEGA